ncbi:MAG: hypothetical protein QOG63_2939 [Thermoleophilaceae bacterium]|nr:hypothetical protein [Thermoleophilaceae bacterium]
MPNVPNVRGILQARVSGPAARTAAWGRRPATARDGRVLLQPRPSRGRPKLHLGCGDRLMPGYLNVDLPPAEGVASGTSRPDVESDLWQLDCPPETIAEIRLHHVFEHFERAEALALLIRWFDWLAPGGVLILETPDFDGCVAGWADRDSAARGKILRHVFGSQEAPWARHLEGWSERLFREVLPLVGFEMTKVEAGASDVDGLLPNVTAHARRPAGAPPREQRIAAAREQLRLSMVADVESERGLLKRWEQRFDELVRPT